MGNYTIFYMFEVTRGGRQAINFKTNVSKILDLKLSSEQIFFRKLQLGAPDIASANMTPVVQKVDSAIHRIKHYPPDSAIGFPNTYPLDWDLSGGQRYTIGAWLIYSFETAQTFQCSKTIGKRGLCFVILEHVQSNALKIPLITHSTSLGVLFNTIHTFVLHH